MKRKIPCVERQPRNSRLASDLAREWGVHTQRVLDAIDGGLLRAVRVRREVFLKNRYHSHTVRPLRFWFFVLNPPTDFPFKSIVSPAGSVKATVLAKRWGVTTDTIGNALKDGRLVGGKIESSHGPPALYVVDPPAAYPRRKHFIPAGATIDQLKRRWGVSRAAIDCALRDGRLVGVRGTSRGWPIYVQNPPAKFPRAIVGSPQGALAVPVPEQAKLWDVCDQAIYAAFRDGRLTKTKVPSPRRTGRQLVTAVANPPAAFPHKQNTGRFRSRKAGVVPPAQDPMVAPKKKLPGRPAGTKKFDPLQDAKLVADKRASGLSASQFASERGLRVEEVTDAMRRERARK